MKGVRLLRWSGSVRSPHTRPHCLLFESHHYPTIPSPHQRYHQSTSAAVQHQTSPDLDYDTDLTMFPSPPPDRVSASARLNALHARLSLSPRLPVETLARCLIHSSADPNPRFNNTSLALLGHDIIGYYTGEAILCRYPRLPAEVVYSAMLAFCGPKTLAVIAREWGVDHAAAPGGEVDPGLLQFARQKAGNAAVNGTGIQLKELNNNPHAVSITASGTERNAKHPGASIKLGSDVSDNNSTFPESEYTSSTAVDSRGFDSSMSSILRRGVTLEDASASFVCALFGAHYLHTGLPLTKAFYDSHILSRHLEYSHLFSFRQPTRDLARLCARENFQPPVARTLVETGRQSRHPVYLVGVFSGREKLGEGKGGSLNEARIRAAVNALKLWYLYSPLDTVAPSQARRREEFPPVMIDGGEVIV